MPGTAAAIGRSGFHLPALLLIALMAHSVGCTRRFPATEVTPKKARVHPQIAWAKLRALRDGAAIASKKLWS